MFNEQTDTVSSNNFNVFKDLMAKQPPFTELVLNGDRIDLDGARTETEAMTWGSDIMAYMSTLTAKDDFSVQVDEFGVTVELGRQGYCGDCDGEGRVYVYNGEVRCPSCDPHEDSLDGYDFYCD